MGCPCDDGHMVTLHEEIAAILSEAGGDGMSTSEIAAAVNRRGNYRKRDGSEITAFQVHGRTRNYAGLFDRDGSMVRLCAEPSPVVELPRTHRTQPRPARPAQAPSTDLVAEAMAALAEPMLRAVDADAVAPHAPGLYAIGASVTGLKALGLEGAGVIYVGKAERSLAHRDLGQHFAVGQTGRSTLRRSLSALLADELGMMPRPRNPLKPADFDRYALDESSDRLLSSWMREHLRLSFWAAPADTVLRPIEIAVIQRLLPPLNLTDCLTPYTSLVKASRRIMAERARQWVTQRRPEPTVEG